MIDVPLRTEKILTDARELETKEYYFAAILLYIQYLEHIMLLNTIRYYAYYNPANINNKLDQILQIKDGNELNFGKILSLMPKKMKNKNTKQACKFVQDIRNKMAAHSYFMVSLDKKDKNRRAIKDVNNYKKIIRRLYKLIRNKHKIKDVELFLYQHPLRNMRKIENEAYQVEKQILKTICRITRENVVYVSGQLPSYSPPFQKFGPLDEYVP